MHLARFPRLKFAHLPTPLEPMERLSKELGGPEIWIKRDDCTGLSTGGNKTRKLEFLMAEAEAMNADIVMTQGATQSNHARQTAAFASKLGMKCHILLEDRTGYDDHNYNDNANVLLDHLHGATTAKYPGGHDMPGEMEKAAKAERADGKKVYVIPGGGSNPTGALGYVNCALELLSQANERALVIDHLVHATGSSGTQAGLIVGLKALNAGIPLLGFGTRARNLSKSKWCSIWRAKQLTSSGVQGSLLGRMCALTPAMLVRVMVCRVRIRWRQSACLPSWRASFLIRFTQARARLV